MSTSKIVNKSSAEPIDRLIHEKSLRIKYVMPIKEMDLMLVVFSNRTVLKTNLSDYPTLKKAKKIQLDNWTLTGNGTGVRWEELDEDLSAKGFIKDALQKDLYTRLQNKDDIRGILV